MRFTGFCAGTNSITFNSGVMGLLALKMLLEMNVNGTVSVDNEDLNGELDDVSQHSKNGVISNGFQQALSSHFDSSSHRYNNKDIGKSLAIKFMCSNIDNKYYSYNFV